MARFFVVPVGHGLWKKMVTEFSDEAEARLYADREMEKLFHEQMKEEERLNTTVFRDLSEEERLNWIRERHFANSWSIDYVVMNEAEMREDLPEFFEAEK